MTRFKAVVAGVIVMAVGACAGADPQTDPKLDLGDFSLGHNVVVTQNARKMGPSRSASAQEWEIVLEDAIAQRFERYDGEKLYHLGINLDGYALAVPGVPLVLAPKSAMVITVNVWDDAANLKLAEPRQLTIFEQFDGGTIISSGLLRDREQQMSNLSKQMAAAVERYLLANANWFGAVADAQAKAASEADILTVPGGVEATNTQSDPITGSADVN